jgi:hypothetical protein
MLAAACLLGQALTDNNGECACWIADVFDAMGISPTGRLFARHTGHHIAAFACVSSSRARVEHRVSGHPGA